MVIRGTWDGSMGSICASVRPPPPLPHRPCQYVCLSLSLSPCFYFCLSVCPCLCLCVCLCLSLSQYIKMLQLSVRVTTLVTSNLLPWMLYNYYMTVDVTLDVAAKPVGSKAGEIEPTWFFPLSTSCSAGTGW